MSAGESDSDLEFEIIIPFQEQLQTATKNLLKLGQMKRRMLERMRTTSEQIVLTRRAGGDIEELQQLKGRQKQVLAKLKEQYDQAQKLMSELTASQTEAEQSICVIQG
jgi:hypothetical protein